MNKNFTTINPANGQIIEEFSYDSADSIAQKLQKAHNTYSIWKKITLNERKQLVYSLAHVLRKYSARDAECITIEMGKPLSQAQIEIEKCASACEFFADSADEMFQPEEVTSSFTKSYITYEPLGVILGIMPWNFPFWQVIRYAVPVLLAGNTTLLKHSPNVTGSALALEQHFLEAGFPEGTFQVLLADIPEISEIINNKIISGVSLTGSTRAGRSVAAAAGNALKPCVLELGGSDPYIILPDANIENAISQCMSGRFVNSGQSCISAKRWIVHKDIVSEFTKRMKEEISALRIGNPLHNPDVGPIARADLRELLASQVERSTAAGAVIEVGGIIPFSEDTKDGFYYAPTLLTGVRPGMPAFDEELFGPVGVIIIAENEEEAFSLAKNTEFGLGAAVFTENIARGEHIARHELEAGSCFVNGFVRSDARLPFGGIKSSGLGREMSKAGFRAFTNIKTVVVL